LTIPNLVENVFTKVAINVDCLVRDAFAPDKPWLSGNSRTSQLDTRLRHQ